MFDTHFVGIGGIGMSALAHVLMDWGQTVSGSDLELSSVTEGLKKKGARIYKGHFASNIRLAKQIVYTAVNAKENREIISAKERDIPMLHRSELLSACTQGKAALAVTGTHGKTSTSALLSFTLMHAEQDPSFAVGGTFTHLNINGRGGRGPLFVFEADESDGSLLNYHPMGAIFTNLELDHVDYWKSFTQLREHAFSFIDQVQDKAHFFYCAHDAHLKGAKGKSYGFMQGADIQGSHFRQQGWNVFFDIHIDGKTYKNMHLPIVGKHHALNALAVFACALSLGIPSNTIRHAFSNYKGVFKRAHRLGEKKGVLFIDDYAHHPTEVKATLSSIKKCFPDRRLMVAFEPHKFSRLKYFIHDFVASFAFASEVVIIDVYGVLESASGVDSQDLVQKIKKRAIYVQNSQLQAFVQQWLQAGDVFITMGAGKISHLGKTIYDNFS